MEGCLWCDVTYSFGQKCLLDCLLTSNDALVVLDLGLLVVEIRDAFEEHGKVLLEEGVGGEVTIDGRPQAQDETQRAFWHAGLVGMRHDGRIEQRRRLRRILVQKIGADEPLAFGRRLHLGLEMDFHFVVALAENRFHAFMAVRKFTQDLTQQARNFFFRQSHDPRDDSPRDVVGAGTDRTQQHARTVRCQSRSGASGRKEVGVQSAKVLPARPGKRAMIPVRT